MNRMNLPTLGGVLLTAVFCLTGRATELYYDTNGATPGFGTLTGTWGTDAYWSADSAGASADLSATTTADDDLHFGTEAYPFAASGTVAVPGAVAAKSLVCESSGAGTLTLSGDGAITLGEGNSIGIVLGNLDLDVALEGSSGLSFAMPQRAVSYDGVIPGTDTLVFSGRTIRSFEIASATVVGNSISGGQKTGATPWFVRWLSETSFSVQIQVFDGYIKCVRLVFSETADGVVCRATDAWYHPNSGKYTEPGSVDFENDSAVEKSSVCTSGSSGNYNGAYGVGKVTIQLPLTPYSITARRPIRTTGAISVAAGTNLRMTGGEFGEANPVANPIAVNGSLELAEPARPSHVFTGAFSGSGQFTFGPYLENAARAGFASTFSNLTSTAFVTVVPGAKICDLTNATDGVLRQSGSSSAMKPSGIYFFENDGTRAEFQLQAKDGYTKCQIVELKQVETNVVARCTHAYYANNDAHPVGSDFRTFTPSEVSNANYYYPETFMLHFRDGTRTMAVTLAAASSMSAATVTVSTNVTVYVDHDKALPLGGGKVEILTNAVVKLNADGSDWGSGIADNQLRYVVHAGGRLEQNAKMAFGGYDGGGLGRRTVIDLMGGVLALSEKSLGDGLADDCDTYMGTVNFTDGGRVTSPLKFRISMDQTWTVSGTKPGYCEAGAIVASSTQDWWTFNIADVTGDAEDDFTYDGSIRSFDNSSMRSKMGICKKGAGTMRFGGTFDSNWTNRVEVLAGRLVFGANNALRTGMPLVLKGGAVTFPDARTNSVSTIELTADSEIAIGAGSVLNVANVAGTAWTAKTKLNFVGPEGPNAVKFADAANGFTEAQVKQIRWNGRHVAREADGRFVIPGFAVFLR